MAIVKQKSNDDWRQKRSQEQIAGGGLPLNAEFRLRRLAENPRLFTSFLSVNELALTASAGIVPCGQVTGSSVYRLGARPVAPYASIELTEQSHAQTQARRQALVRMLREAERLGAEGVLGVRLTGNAHDWGQDMIEFTATGTAFRRPRQRATALPYAAALSGQEFHALHQAGYRPVGLAFGVCVYCQVGSPATTQVMRGGVFNTAARVNQEMTEYTRGFTKARLHATRGMEEDATCQHGEGVVGVQIERKMEVREVEVEVFERKQRRHDLIATFFALGTIIRSDTGATPRIHGAMPLNP